MRHRLARVLIGGGALALGLLGAPALQAGAQPPPQPPGHHPGPRAETFTLTPAGADVRIVGTTKWSPTRPAGPSATVAAGGSTALPRTAAKAARPSIPDVGETPRSTAPVGSGSGSRPPVPPGPGAAGPPGRRHVGGGGPGTGRPGTLAGPTPGLTSTAGID